jgi:hypothetical protein
MRERAKSTDPGSKGRQRPQSGAPEKVFEYSPKGVDFGLYIPNKVYTQLGMKLDELKAKLTQHSDYGLRIFLPDGTEIPRDFHVTEVAHIAKKFVDCGGTVRTAETCVLQIWLASNDKDHRLTSGKAAAILELAQPLLPSGALEVEVEYGETVVAQYRVGALTVIGLESRISLENKQTDCLAREACGLESCCS